MMELYDFDKVPALMSLHPTYNERNVFYGPFDEKFLEDFIKQNLFPLCMPINSETLKSLKEDERKIVLAVVEDEDDEKSMELIKLLKAAASANRDLVFSYVGFKQWQDFVETFGIDKKTRLPRMVVWDGNEEYLSVIGSESIGEEDQGSQITQFLEGYREGRTESKKISGPSFISFLNSLIGMGLVFIINFVVVVLVLIQTNGKLDDERSGATNREAASPTSSPSTGPESREAHRSGSTGAGWPKGLPLPPNITDLKVCWLRSRLSLSRSLLFLDSRINWIFLTDVTPGILICA
ncbi:Protein disulfide isomerase-like 5-2 [Ancistrocladus abbreviatus]